MHEPAFDRVLEQVILSKVKEVNSVSVFIKRIPFPEEKHLKKKKIINYEKKNEKKKN